MFLSHFTKCTQRNKRRCFTQQFSKTSPCPRETKHFNMSKSTKLQKPFSLLHCGCTCAKFSPFDKQKTGSVQLLFGSDRVWPPLHQMHLSFLGAQPFICYRVHLRECIPARQQKTSEVWSAFVHKLKVSMKPLRSTEISHWGIFSLDKAGKNSLTRYLKFIIQVSKTRLRKMHIVPQTGI